MVLYKEDLVEPGKIIFMKTSNIYNPLYWTYFYITLYLWNFTKIWNFTDARGEIQYGLYIIQGD